MLPRLLLDLAVVLGVAAGTTLVFRRLGQPAVLGYILAGIIVGPHLPVPLVADLGNVQTLAELGVILVIFSVGLEFDLASLVRRGPSSMILGVTQLAFTAWLGFLAGRALGWGLGESGLMGAALALSSTMIIAKLFEEHGSRGHLRDRVMAVLVVQDLAAILLLAGLDAAAAAGGVSGPARLAWTAGKILLLLAGLLGVGGLVAPRLLRWAADHGRDETLLVASVGICFTCAVLAARIGCSLALGAFLAGMLAAASGRAHQIETLVQPLRDLFAAIFFVAVGMLLEPRALLAQAGPILVLTVTVLVGSTLGASLGGALAGLPLRTGFRTGLALAQPGEFSFVLVGLGGHAAFLRPEFFPVPVGVCLLLALVGPWLFRNGDALAAGLERRLPDRVNAYLGIYQRWASRLGRFSLRSGPAPLRRPLAFLLLDAALVNAAIVGPWLLRRHLAAAREPGAGLALLGGQVVVLAWLTWGLGRRADRIAERILEDSPTSPAAGRFQLKAALALIMLLLVGAPSLALLQPFRPEGPLLAVLLGGLMLLLGLVRSHSRPEPLDQAVGSEWLLDRVQRPWSRAEATPEGRPDPGLASVRLTARCPHLGRPLADLGLEERTGATPLALVRDGRPVPPGPGQVLQAEDRVALCGKPEALAAARRLLEPGGGEPTE